jgi:hypothetical protein
MYMSWIACVFILARSEYTADLQPPTREAAKNDPGRHV